LRFFWKGNTRGYNKTYQVCCNTWNIGDGNACCNENAKENPNGEFDVPYYTSKKCCRNGLLFDKPCLNRGILLKYSFKIFMALFILLVMEF